MGVTGYVHSTKVRSSKTLTTHRLYDIIGYGEVWPLAAYAARHFEQHKRPLRIAVDEACWRFTNLTVITSSDLSLKPSLITLFAISARAGSKDQGRRASSESCGESDIVADFATVATQRPVALRQRRSKAAMEKEEERRRASRPHPARADSKAVPAIEGSLPRGSWRSRS